MYSISNADNNIVVADDVVVVVVVVSALRLLLLPDVTAARFVVVVVVVVGFGVKGELGRRHRLRTERLIEKFLRRRQLMRVTDAD